MTNFDLYYDKLPIEIKSKIMFRSGIEHPTAKIIKEFIVDITFLNLCRYNLYKLTYEPLTFYNYICEINYLEHYEKVPLEEGIEIEELIYQILVNHVS